MISDKPGHSIAWDGDKELMLDESEANTLLRRDYRGKWKHPQV